MKLTEEQRLKRNAYGRAYRAAHREEQRAYHEARRRAKGMQPFVRVSDSSLSREDQIRQTDRLRYQRDKPKRLAAMKDWQRRNRETLRIKKAARFQATYPFNKDKLREKNRIDRQKHRAKRLATHRNWQRANRDKGRAYEARYLSKKPWVRVIKNNRRRVRKLNAFSDGSAEEHIKKLRSAKSLPCNYCGVIINGITAHIDHIIPLSRGGSHTADNLCAACEFCNCSKCDKLLSEWVSPIRQPVLSIRKEGY